MEGVWKKEEIINELITTFFFIFLHLLYPPPLFILLILPHCVFVYMFSHISHSAYQYIFTSTPFFVPSLSFSLHAFISHPSFVFGLSSVPPVQIIQDRVDSHVSRNRLLWNSLPGGLYALPQYSTDPAQFPFYYAILGKSLIVSSCFCYTLFHLHL